MTKAERTNSLIDRLLFHRSGGRVACDRDECLVEAGTFDRQRFDARAAVDQRLEQAVRARVAGSSKIHSPPSFRAVPGRAERQARPIYAFAGGRSGEAARAPRRRGP